MLLFFASSSGTIINWFLRCVRYFFLPFFFNRRGTGTIAAHRERGFKRTSKHARCSSRSRFVAVVWGAFWWSFISPLKIPRLFPQIVSHRWDPINCDSPVRCTNLPPPHHHRPPPPQYQHPHNENENHTKEDSVHSSH